MNSLGIDGKVYQHYLWLYIGAPFLGGIVASLFMRFVHNPNLHVKSKKEKEVPEIEEDFISNSYEFS